MKELKLPRGWNADGFKLENLRRLLQNNGFDLVNGYVIAKIDENWDWVYSNPLKEEKNWNQNDKAETEKRSRKEIPLCKKCGAYHWPMHKCPAKKEK